MNYSTNANGELMLGDISAIDLAKQYGTPLYVMDESIIRNQMRQYKSALDEYYDGYGLISFALKAFCCKEICRIAQQEGLGLDAVSLGELFTASSVNFDMSKILLHGNNKSKQELSDAISKKVGRIVVDNITELKTLNLLCEQMNTTAKILFRIKPGIDAHTHSFVQTGKIDSKFGFALETGEAMEAVKMALSLNHIDLKGIHCHIGSQILLSDPFVLAAKVMINFLAQIKKETGKELTDLNLGGGYGIFYTNGDNPPPIKDSLKHIFAQIKASTKEHGLHLPFVMFEPARSIVGESGTTLYTVGNVKHIPNIRTYVAVDGSMCDNPRYMLYQSLYTMTIANKANDEKSTNVTVAGKCCENELLGENIPLQETQPGDILAVHSTGAYNFSMFSHYNKTLRPPVVMVNNGKSRIIVKGDTLETIIEGDI